MSLESDTISLLTSNASVIALCPDSKIFFAGAREDVQPPFIALSRIFTATNASLDNASSGAARLDNAQIQATVYTRNYIDTVTLAEAVRNALEPSAQPKFTMVDQRDGYDDFADVYGIILLFSAWHQSNAPS